MPPFIGDIAQTILLADIADILIVSVFLFIGITWLRRSHSGSAARRIMALGLLLIAVYLLADLVHLYLVRQLLRLLLLGFLVAAVIVFQADIRRLLDRIGSWGDPRAVRHDVGHGVDTVELLLEVVNRLAEQRIGAIIALRGEDPWDSHIQGGIELDGVASRPLIEGIFRPGSPGHDGAMLMDGERVTRFAAHLPLASRIPEVSRYGGTRHAAALGLANECDAFVVVVSEERGTISVAEQGILVEMTSLAELASRLGTFWEHHYSPSRRDADRWLSRSSLETLGLSLLSASAIWLLFSYSADTISRTFEVPIEFRNLPAGWAMDSDTIPGALVTLNGSERAFGRIDLGELVISFDLALPDSGLNILTLTGQNLALPAGLTLANVTPRELRVTLHPQVAIPVLVQVRTTEPVPDSLRLTADPRVVTVLVAAGASAPSVIMTAPFDLHRLRPAGTARVRIELPEGVRLAPDQPGEVIVTLRRPGDAAVR